MGGAIAISVGSGSAPVTETQNSACGALNRSAHLGCSLYVHPGLVGSHPMEGAVLVTDASGCRVSMLTATTILGSREIPTRTHFRSPIDHVMRGHAATLVSVEAAHLSLHIDALRLACLARCLHRYARTGTWTRVVIE